jgi:hypothetical protein
VEKDKALSRTEHFCGMTMHPNGKEEIRQDDFLLSWRRKAFLM